MKSRQSWDDVNAKDAVIVALRTEFDAHKTLSTRNSSAPRGHMCDRMPQWHFTTFGTGTVSKTLYKCNKHQGTFDSKSITDMHARHGLEDR